MAWKIAMMGIVTLLSVSCVSIPVKPEGKTSRKLIAFQSAKSLPQNTLIAELSRSTLLEGEMYQAVYVEATLHTPALAYRRLQTKAKQRKWGKARLAAELQELVGRQQQKLCFDLLIKTNNGAAEQASNWNIQLQVDGSLQKLADLQFVTRREREKLALASSFEHVPHDMKYFLETVACFDRKHAFLRDLTLIIDPTFDLRDHAATLTWQFKP